MPHCNLALEASSGPRRDAGHQYYLIGCMCSGTGQCSLCDYIYCSKESLSQGAVCESTGPLPCAISALLLTDESCSAWGKQIVNSPRQTVQLMAKSQHSAVPEGLGGHHLLQSMSSNCFIVPEWRHHHHQANWQSLVKNLAKWTLTLPDESSLLNGF